MIHKRFGSKKGPKHAGYRSLPNDIKLGCLTFFILLVCHFLLLLATTAHWLPCSRHLLIQPRCWKFRSSMDLTFLQSERNQPWTDSIKSSVDGSLFLQSGEHPVHDSVESAVGGYLFAQSGFRCLSDLKVKPCIAASQLLSQYVYRGSGTHPLLQNSQKTLPVPTHYPCTTWVKLIMSTHQNSTDGVS